MEHYVTLFDSLYLPQGLALHLSMERHVINYTLWVLCVDDETHAVLESLSLPNVRLLKLSALVTSDLLKVRPGRSKGEYCWTLTPFAPRFVFESEPAIDRVTYLDADLWFRKEPSAIFAEFDNSGKHVLITDHAYAPEYDHTDSSGQFCVQFMTFTRHGGESVRKWWEERCIEWCFARFEDGKFGDQKYLDDWPNRFKDQVHVLQDKEYLLAPWNATRYPYGRSICWHFQDLRITQRFNHKYGVDFGIYPIPMVARAKVYGKYVQDLMAAISLLQSIDFVVRSQRNTGLFAKMINVLLGVWRQMWRIKIHVQMDIK